MPPAGVVSANGGSESLPPGTSPQLGAGRHTGGRFGLPSENAIYRRRSARLATMEVRNLRLHCSEFSTTCSRAPGLPHRLESQLPVGLIAAAWHWQGPSLSPSLILACAATSSFPFCDFALFHLTLRVFLNAKLSFYFFFVSSCRSLASQRSNRRLARSLASCTCGRPTTLLRKPAALRSEPERYETIPYMRFIGPIHHGLHDTICKCK